MIPVMRSRASRISRADRPHAALALGLVQHSHGIGGAPQLVGVDGLQVLKLEPDIRVVTSQFQADQRRSYDDPRDALARLPYLGQSYGADSFKCHGHRLFSSRTATCRVWLSLPVRLHIGVKFALQSRREGSLDGREKTPRWPRSPPESRSHAPRLPRRTSNHQAWRRSIRSRL